MQKLEEKKKDGIQIFSNALHFVSLRQCYVLNMLTCK